MTQSYQTIFELGFASFPWAAVFGPLLFIVVGLLLILLFKRRTFYVVAGTFIASMAALIFLMLLVNVVPNFFSLRNAYVSGKSVTVEGTVQDFQGAPMVGPARESFSVQGVLFSYNALDGTPCFHNAPIHRGPIREGLNVRIHYYRDCIQRVEIAKR